MPNNLEIKASYSSLVTARRIALRTGARYITTMRQVDTYFRVRSGRLKLREIDGSRFELVYYRRRNHRGSRYSDYRVIPVDEAHPLKRVLRAVFGELVVVRKKRELFLYKNARIHLDQVRSLGSFLEFEVMVKYGRRQAEALMQFLKREFGIRKSSLIAVSYSDMLLEKN